MSVKFGLHTRPQFLAYDELVKAWIRADQAGFYWISVSDRLYTKPIYEKQEPCYEAVAAMAHLAAVTERVKVACLMFNVRLRHPGVLFKAMATVNQIARGRVEFGLGAAGAPELPEYADFGMSDEDSSQRLERLEEALVITRALFGGEPVDFDGKYYRLTGARSSPGFGASGTRLWVGGTGARRTPRIAAEHADGMNVPYMTVEDCRERFDQLNRFCERAGRDPSAVLKSVSLNFYMGADERAAAQNRLEFEEREPRRAGALLGTPREAAETVNAYHEAGADIVNIVFRHSIDWEAYEAFAVEVLPQFAA